MSDSNLFGEVCSNAALLSEIDPIDLSKIDGKEKQLSFPLCVDLLEQLKVAGAFIHDNLTDCTPNGVLDLLNSSLKKANTLVDAIRSYSPPTEGEIQEQHKSNESRFIQKLTTIVNTIERNAIPAAMAYHRAHTDQPAALNYEVYKTNKNIEQIREKYNEAESLVATLKKLTSKSGVALHSKTFHDKETEHKQSARNWIIMMFITSTISILISLFLIDDLDRVVSSQENKSLSNPILTLHLVSRFVIISMLYVFVIWAIRNHRAHRHMAVVCGQKAQALDTFESFVNSTEKQDIRDAVLLETTRAIFSPTVTGYLGPNEEIPSSPIQDLQKLINKA